MVWWRSFDAGYEVPTMTKLLLSILLAIALVGVLLTSHYKLAEHAYQVGYQKGLDDAPELTDKQFKEILMNNQDLLNKTCYIWWFKMEHSERKLKKG